MALWAPALCSQSASAPDPDTLQELTMRPSHSLQSHGVSSSRPCQTAGFTRTCTERCTKQRS